MARSLCELSELETRALTSPAAPIVLLKKKKFAIISENVAPECDLLGVMLPCSPLHHLLLHFFNAPLIMTSANLNGEPICIENQHALEKLQTIADYFLTHNRRILHALDDSIVRLIAGKITVLRRGRGYSSIPITLNKTLLSQLAVGGQLKNSIAFSYQNQVVFSSYLGDLNNFATQKHFEKTIEEMQRFYQFQPENIVHDLHLDYASSQYALTSTLPKRAIQHHHAHALSCMAENQLNAPVLAITWDGSGLGENNQLWGGEFFIFHQNEIEHYAQFLPFPLVGGEKATKEPRRIALAILEKIKIEYDLPFSPQEKNLLLSALAKNINCPKTSSVGRLFDAMASFLSVCQISSYEGQASMKVEMLALKSNSLEHYPFDIVNEKLLLIDWQSFFINIIKDIENAVSDAVIARKFHNTLAEIVLQIAFMANQKNIVLSGGCFQNALLTECVVEKLTAAQFCVYRHQNVPPNDQGLALGQLYEF